MKETLNSYSTNDVLTEGEVEVSRIMKTHPGFCPVPWKHTACLLYTSPSPRDAS